MRFQCHLPLVASSRNDGDRGAGETNRNISVDGDTEARNNLSNLRVVRALDAVAAQLIGSAALTRAIGCVLTLNKKKSRWRKTYLEGAARAPATKAATTRVLENIFEGS